MFGRTEIIKLISLSFKLISGLAEHIIIVNSFWDHLLQEIPESD